MHHTKTFKYYLLTGLSLLTLAGAMVAMAPVTSVSAKVSPKTPDTGGTDSSDLKLDAPSKAKYHCGGGKNQIATSLNLGCKGKGNGTVDLLFAIIRFLSNGVGLVVVASIVYGGIQYTMSRGDPQATASAIDRIRNSLLALLLFVFAYAIINYMLPAGFLK